MPPQPSTELEGYYNSIVTQFARGKVIPFLGAGVNLYERPSSPTPEGGVDGNAAQEDEPEKTPEWLLRFLPSGRELAEYLAGVFQWSEPETRRDLQRVSQNAEVMDGRRPLYDELYTLFGRDYPPASIHEFLAGMPKLLRAKGYVVGLPLIITTNYDDVLEGTFRKKGTPFDVVTYGGPGKVGSNGELRVVQGKFLHLANAERYKTADSKADDEWSIVESPNTHPFDLENRTVILKIHGSVTRSAADRCSFVITEDDYIDYLAQMDFSNPLPSALAAHMQKSRFLYMGYGLRDWNLRVILKRIAGGQPLSANSWAIEASPTEIEQRFWSKRNVNIVEMELKSFVSELQRRIHNMRSILPPPPRAE